MPTPRMPVQRVNVPKLSDAIMHQLEKHDSGRLAQTRRPPAARAPAAGTTGRKRPRCAKLSSAWLRGIAGHARAAAPTKH